MLKVPSGADAARRFNAADLAQLESAGHSRPVARREVVPLDGAALVIVLEGFFRIFRNAAFVRDVTLGLASTADVLAPAIAFGGRSGETGAEALSTGRILYLSPELWRARALAEPGLWLKMAASVGRRVGRMQKRLEELSRAGVESRIAATLLELADDFGQATPAGLRLDIPLSQEDLARLAGTTRETCSSSVAELARRGLVRGGRLRGLVLLDPAALETLAQIGR